MANYSFIIKKGEISIEVKSNDSLLIAQEFDKWLAGFLEISPEKISIPKKEVISIKSDETEKISKERVEIELEVKEKKPSPVYEKAEEAENKSINQAQKDFEESENLKSMEKAVEYLSNKVKETSQETSEELEEDICAKVEISDNTETDASGKFSDILQKKVSLASEKSEKISANSPSDAFDVLSGLRASKSMSDNDAIEELIELKKPQSLLDYLLITAFYLTEYEKLDRYSLKQINGKIISFTQKPIDHAILQKAVSQDYLEVVPDYTGMAGVTEYRITDEGINYLVNEL